MIANIRYKARNQKIKILVDDSIIDKYIEDLKNSFAHFNENITANQIQNGNGFNNNNNDIYSYLKNPLLTGMHTYTDCSIVSSFWCGYRLTAKQKTKIIVTLIRYSPDIFWGSNIFWGELDTMINLFCEVKNWRVHHPGRKYISRSSQSKDKILYTVMKEILKRKHLVENDAGVMEQFTYYDFFDDLSDIKKRDEFYSKFEFTDPQILAVYIGRLNAFAPVVRYKDYNGIIRLNRFIEDFMSASNNDFAWYINSIKHLLPDLTKTAEIHGEESLRLVVKKEANNE